MVTRATSITMWVDQATPTSGGLFAENVLSQERTDIGMRQVNGWMWIVGAPLLITGCLMDQPKEGKTSDQPLVLTDATPVATEGILEYGTVVFAENPTTLIERGDFHGYEFDGKAGGIVTITMSSSSCGAPDTVLNLFRPEGITGNRGTSLIENDDAFLASCFLDSQIKGFKLPVSGRYLVVATTFLQQGGGTNGHYRLQLSCDNNACVLAGAPTFASTRIAQTAIDSGGFPRPR